MRASNLRSRNIVVRTNYEEEKNRVGKRRESAVGHSEVLIKSRTRASGGGAASTKVYSDVRSDGARVECQTFIPLDQCKHRERSPGIAGSAPALL